MTRARELANFADNTSGLESLTVSDITDLSVSASNINSSTNQITDSSTDLNVDSNTLVVDKSENKVGIGTASPSSTLTVKGTLGLETTDSTNKWLAYAYTDDTLRLNYNGAGNDEVVVKSSGEVGIGDTSPSYKLTVNAGSVQDTACKIIQYGGYAGFIVEGDATNTGTAMIRIAGTGTGDSILQYTVGGSNKFQIFVDNSVTNDPLIFYDYTSDSYPLALNNGNVGIGTTTPTSGYKLDVVNNGATGIRIGDTSDNSRVQYQLDNNIATTTISKDGSGFNTEYKFKTQNTAGSLVDNLSLVGGNVGINETSPNHKLVVQGNIQIGDWQTYGSRYIGYARADNSNFGTAGASGLEIESVSIGGNYSQHLHFWSHFYNGGSGRRMTIKHNGLVGINNTDPQKLLHLNDATAPTIKFTNSTTGTGATDGVDIDVTGTSMTITNHEDGQFAIKRPNNNNIFRATSSAIDGIHLNARVTKASGDADTFFTPDFLRSIISFRFFASRFAFSFASISALPLVPLK